MPIYSLRNSLVDPHHTDADPDSVYHPDADPDTDFYLMRIRIFILFEWNIKIALNQRFKKMLIFNLMKIIQNRDQCWNF
jgi:hypothetical protein